jgi:type VI secretion system secreted protein Hcp
MAELRTRIDGFLKVPDIPGPSERDGHEEEIEVYGVDFKMTAPHDPNSLSRRGRVSLGMLTLTKHYDMSSPYLAKALYDNTKLDEVVFTCRRTIDGETSDYLVVTLTDASVIAYDMHASIDEPDVIEDVIAFAYKTIKFTYDNDHEVEMNVATAA